MKLPGWRWIFGPACGLWIVGCASHNVELLTVRESLARGDVNTAVAEFEKHDQKRSDLLYLLDRGYLMHLAGRWDESNAAFERAEARARDLYTKSLSRGAASLVTNDLALPYRSTPHELQFVPYYRALNYLALGAPQEALVEARKANASLASYAEATQGEERFRQDAFLQYFTGLLYESEGEANDAVVSLRDARQRYLEYQNAFGGASPSWLLPDFYAAAEHVGLAEEMDALRALDTTIVERAEAGNADNTVVFFESGFVPYRESVNITLPVLSSEAGAETYVTEYQDHLYEYEASRVKLDHVLAFAFPALVPVPRQVQACELVLPSGEVIEAEPALDLAAIATADFQRRLPGILLKTVARVLVKEAARKEAKEQDETLGWIVNVINVATEHADTRGWILLPGQIFMLKARLEPGTHTLTARFLSAEGAVQDEWQRTVEVAPGKTSFAAFRSFK